MDTTYDLGIIGAGIIGACTAWYARKKYPDWRIALIDQSLAGHGASLYSASLDIPYGHTPLRRELARRSGGLYRKLKQDIKDLPIISLPVYSLVRAKQRDYLLTQFVDEGTRVGDADALEVFRNKFPQLRIPKHCSLLIGTTGQRALRNWVAIRIAEAFAGTDRSALLESTKILAIESENGTHRLRNPAGLNIRSKRLVIAVGPWLNSGPFHTYAEAKAVRNKKIVALHLQTLPLPGAPVFHFYDDEAFLLPQPEAGRWLFSFRCEEWDVDPEGPDLVLKKADREKGIAILKKYYPQLTSSCNGGRVFCDAYGHNGDPLIWKIPDKTHCIIAGAGTGSGFRLAPAIAESALQFFH